jgi:hypothetical protein
LLLVIFSYRKGIFKFDSLIKIKFLKICLSCVFLYVFLEASIGLVGPYVYGASGLVSFASFAGIVLCGMAIYVFALSVTKTYSLSEVKKLL